MKSPQTTIMLLVMIFLLVGWRSGKLVKILNLAFQK
jgi:hypothetical protein